MEWQWEWDLTQGELTLERSVIIQIRIDYENISGRNGRLDNMPLSDNRHHLLIINIIISENSYKEFVCLL